jgi:hypothetical protein
LADIAGEATQIALFTAKIYQVLGNREPMVQARVDDAKERFRQYTAIQTELYDYYGYVYKYGTTTNTTVENPAAGIDYLNALGAAKARSLYRVTATARQAIEVMVEDLTGGTGDIAALDSSRYPDFASET